MPRRPTVSDDAILDAVGRAAARLGVSRLRLRDVGDEVGLAPPTLVLRFGSKRALLSAFARRAGRRAVTAMADPGSGNPLAILVKGLLDPATLSDHATRAQIEDADPSLRDEAARVGRRRRKAMRALLDRAAAEGRLVKGTRTGRLARSLDATWHGALATWLLYRKRSKKRWVRRELRAVLEPHRPS